MQELPLNGSYDSESQKLSNRRCVNFIPVVSDNGSLSTLSLMPTVGREKGKNIDSNVGVPAGTNINPAKPVKSNAVQWTVSNVPSTIFVKDQMVVAAGSEGAMNVSKLLKYDADTIQPDGERVRIAVSPNTIVIVGYGRRDTASVSNNYYIQYSQGNAFNWNLHSPTLSAKPIVDVAFLGGRFLYCNYDPSSPKVYYSSLTSPVADPLDFIAPDGNTGLIKGIEVFSNILYVFGETKTYMYRVTDNTDIPYALIGSIDVGLYQPESKVSTGSGIFFIGKTATNNYGLYRINGGSFQKISNPAMEFQLSKNNLYDTYGDTDNGKNPKWPDYIPVFKMNDSDQDVIVFNSPKVCLCFTEASNLWHERKTYGRENWDCIGYGLTPEGPVFISDTWAENGLGGYDTNISEVNRYSGLELGNLVNREVVTSPFNALNDRMIVPELQPIVEIDFSEPDPLWADPQIMLSVSYDYGVTFEQERSLGTGKSGSYKKKTRFFSFGYVDQSFTVKLRVMNPYPTRIIKLLARTEKGGY